MSKLYVVLLLLSVLIVVAGVASYVGVDLPFVDEPSYTKHVLTFGGLGLSVLFGSLLYRSKSTESKDSTQSEPDF